MVTRKIRNSKFETRNNFKFLKQKIQIKKRPVSKYETFEHLDFEFV